MEVPSSFVQGSMARLDAGYVERCLIGLDINNVLDDTKDIEIASMNLVAILLNSLFGCRVGMLPPSVVYEKATHGGTTQISKVERGTKAVQIHYLQNHFVVSAQFNGTIYVYDSLDNEEHLISVVSKLRPQLELLYENIDTDSIKLVVLQSQGVSNLCGCFAAANAYKLLNLLQINSIPAQTTYNTSKMRKHLFNCLKRKMMQPFPEETNEEIPFVDLTEPVLSSVVQPKAGEKPEILLATNPAAEKGFDLESIKECILSHGFWCRAPDHTNTTLLHGAAGFGNTEAVKFLIKEQHVDPDVKDESGLVPLHNAVEHHHYATAELLIEFGASVNIQDACGSTPMHRAAMSKDLEMYMLLWRHGGDPNKENKDGNTPDGIMMMFLQQWNSFYEARESSKALEQVQLRMDNQETTRRVIRPRLLPETSENLGATVRPGAASEIIEPEKGRKTVRNTSKRHHSNKRKKSKFKKAVILSRREKSLLQKILDKSPQGSLDFTQFSVKTKRERKLLKKSIAVIRLKKCAGSNHWKIVDPLVNNGSHEPPDTSITSVPESTRTSEALEAQSTAYLPSVSSDSIVNVSGPNVVSGDNCTFVGGSKTSGTAVAAEVERGYERKNKPVITQESCTQFADHSRLQSDSEQQQKFDILKNQYRMVAAEQRKTFLKNVTVLARALHTSHLGPPDQRTETQAETRSDYCTSNITSLLPNFDDLGLEEERDMNQQAERDNNFETGVKKTGREYLIKKGSSD